ncbi:PadR family transcriptional regulator [Dactylosporangium sp. CA-233914]|uniref:PadR family transcriptional regulator n=1 Tax=Dactylosporangium sp. CA-233914 TaxID=3239934 RepID=UPI003D9293EC
MASTRGKQTEMAVLGALSIEPMTGYALREAIRDVLGHFWSESFGQIYPALAELERHGYVTRSGSTRAGSSMFAITPSGTQRLRDLLTQPVQATPPRNGLLLRLFFGRTLGVDACRALIAQAKADAQRQLDELDTIAAQVAGETQHPDDTPFLLLTISAGRHSARAALAWADESLAALDTMRPNPADKDETR